MSQVRIIIDGATLMDADVSMTTGALPELADLRDKLTPANGTFSTWSATIIGTLGAELIAGKAAGQIPDITITVTTDATGYTIGVARS